MTRQSEDRGDQGGTAAGCDEVPELGHTATPARARPRPRSSRRRSLDLVPPLPLTLPPLPLPLTSFIGRKSVTAALAARLRQPGTRLLTLTGAGGVGKTRLALQVAAALRSDFPDGVGFIPLAAVRAPHLVLATIAQHLGLQEGDRRSLLRRLQAHLAGMRCLLVLDNFEHVIDAAPELTELLAACPALTLLVTSRTLLRVSGEQTFPVPPLTLAPAGTEAEVLDAEAVRLFLDRAQAVQPDFALTEASAPVVGEICARLDGLPLAIELAAVWLRSLPLEALPALLARRLPLLEAGLRDAPDRQRTMRSAIAWSYDLLTQDDQRLFRCLSVFAGTFTPEAAEAVCPTLPSTLHSLGSLVDQSLVRPAAGVHDQPRYAMLETIREFGSEQLALTDEHDKAHWRHARYFLELVESLDPELDEPRQAMLIRKLDLDRHNLQVALVWFLDRGDAESALRLAASPRQYWEMRGYLTEARDWLERALALPGGVNPETRALALWKLGYFHYDLGDHDKALAHMEESLAIYESLDHRWGRATALNALGLMVQDLGDLQRVRVYHEQALALRRDLDDRAGIAASLGNLGNVARAQGDFARARSLHEEALAIRLELGRPRGIAYQSVNLGNLAHFEGRLDEAKDLLQQGLTILGDLGDHMGVALAAQRLGNVALEAGDLSDAVGYYQQAIGLHRRLNLQRGLITCIEYAAYAVATHDASKAGRLLGAANSLRAATGTARAAADELAWERAVATTHTALGASRFDAAWQEGEKLTLIAAVQEVETALVGLAATLVSPSMDAAATVVGWDGADAGLTPREVEVARLLARGLSNQAIADELFISVATVKRHVTTILAKLELPSRAAVISQAHRLGIAGPDPRHP